MDAYELYIKTFSELTAEEVYEILENRMAVFVVEQKCPYQDIDGMDDGALHLCIKKDGDLKAYLRIVEKDKEQYMVQIGRVLTTERGAGLGAEIMKAGIAAAAERMDAKKIYIEAQVYAMGFYEQLGFKAVSEEFLEDGIPHIQMILEL